MRKIPINKPSITELEVKYVNDAIANGWGNKCYDYINLFEKKFASYNNSNYALATSSCTGALHLTLMALGIKPGDEVILPDLTWIATVEPILYIGARPVFADVLSDTWCINPQSVREKITSRTKAIIVVHLYGNLCEMDEILKIADEFKISVVEDAAEGLGSVYKGKKAGSIGHVGVFSFHGTKTMSTGEGGAIITNDYSIYEKVKILNDHGRNPNDPDHKVFWMRNFGYKYKISNLQAAMGCAQIERIVELVDKKREIFSWYKKQLHLLDCQLNPEREFTINSYWLPTVIVKNKDFNRENFFNECFKNNIDTRPLFYPLSSLPMFLPSGKNEIAYFISPRGVNLPSYHDISEEEVIFVCDILKKYL